jgi:hypothetical protein
VELFSTYTVTFTDVPEVLEHLIPIIASSESAAALSVVGEPELFDMFCCKYLSKSFKKDYPDIYGVVETVSHLQSQNEIKSMQEELEGLKKANQTLQEREAQLELSKYHPDFEQIKESDDFHNWAEAQPLEIRRWIYENNSDGTLAARAIDLYKKDRGLGIDKKSTKKVSKNEGADLLVKTNEQVQTPESKDIIFNRSDIANMTDEEFMQYEKDIVKAQREGRVK